jgi:hypothetical protein
MPTRSIPAPIARLLRSGAYMTLSLAADSISEAAGSSERATGRAQTDVYEPELDRFDRARALLDLFGWQDADEPVTLHLDPDLEPHRKALLDAMHLDE